MDLSGASEPTELNKWKFRTMSRRFENSHIDEAVVPPPIRWAGGKRWLVGKYPDLFTPRSGRLIEPFAGSAAVFFLTMPRRALLSDMNEELIDVYRAIKSDHQAVMKVLRFHSDRHDKSYYYQIRSKRETDGVKAAARMLYLNRTCFNALYRVNRKGEFNVPIGSKVNAFRSDDDFSGVARLLNRAKLIHGDFEKAIHLAETGDLIYVDPPYTVRHNLNGFIKYNEKIFTFEDQIRLRRVLDKAVSAGADVIVSNADHESIRDLYADFGLICSVNRASSISGSSTARGPTSEVLVGSHGMVRRLAVIE